MFVFVTEILIIDCCSVKLTLKMPVFFLDDLSPPERSLRNIHLYEMENPSPFSSIGALYEEKGYKAPASHHSVFVKRKRHKLRNPFRVFEDDNEEMSSSLKSR